MNDLPTHDAFMTALNSAFPVLDGPAQGLEVQLTQVSEIRTLPHQRVFSILFQGPLEWFLPQHIYHLTHAQLGEFDLFLVPVGQESTGFVYEAVFNQSVP